MIVLSRISKGDGIVYLVHSVNTRSQVHRPRGGHSDWLRRRLVVSIGLRKNVCCLMDVWVRAVLRQGKYMTKPKNEIRAKATHFRRSSARDPREEVVSSFLPQQTLSDVSIVAVVVIVVFTLKTVLTSIQYPPLAYSSRQRNEFPWSQANPK